MTLFHTWSNESEMAALNTIVKEFEARGHTIVAASVPHEVANEAPLTSLIVAGTPPNIFIAADAGTSRGLCERGQGQVVGPLFDSIGATPEFPKTVLEAITIDGDVRKIPVAVHIDGMVYYNKKVADAKAASADVQGIEFPESAGAINDYPIVVLAKAPNEAAAQAFVKYVRCAKGQAVLTRAGFQAP